MRRVVLIILLIPILLSILTLNLKLTLADSSCIIVSVFSFNKYSKRSISNYPIGVPITITGDNGVNKTINVPVSECKLPPGTYTITAPSTYTDPWGTVFTFHSWLRKDIIRTQIIYSRSVKLKLKPGSIVCLELRFTFTRGFYYLNIKFKDDYGYRVRVPSSQVRIYRGERYYGYLKYNIGTVSYWNIRVNGDYRVTPYLWSDNYKITVPAKFIGTNGYAYYFKKWSTGEILPHKSITLTSDTHLTVYYTRKPLVIISVDPDIIKINTGDVEEVLVKVTSTLYEGKVKLAIKINGMLRQRFKGLSVSIEPNEITLSSESTKTVKLIVKADKNAYEGKYLINIIVYSPPIKYTCGTLKVIVQQPLRVIIDNILLETISGKRVEKILPLELAKVTMKIRVLKGYKPVSDKSITIKVLDTAESKLKFISKTLTCKTNHLGYTSIGILFRAGIIDEATYRTRIGITISVDRIVKRVEIPITICKPKIEYTVVHRRDYVVLKFKVLYPDNSMVTNRSDIISIHLRELLVNLNVSDSGLAEVKIPYNQINYAKKITIELHYKPYGPIPLLSNISIPVERAYIKILHLNASRSTVKVRVQYCSLLGQPLYAIHYALLDGVVVAKAYGYIVEFTIPIEGGRHLVITAIPCGELDKIILYGDLSTRVVYARID